MIAVAALYIDPRGPYVGRPDVDAWDEARDARKYDGPWPVVAHPACGPWGALKHLYRGSEGGPDCALRAVCQVRDWGGVLEHPKGSGLWKEAAIPYPGELPDQWGGRTIEVSQVDWGHVARKRTWLYLVRVGSVGPMPTPREPTHWIGGFRSAGRESPKRYKSNGGAVPPGIKICSAEQRRRTPPAFADWLLSLARSVRRGAT